MQAKLPKLLSCALAATLAACSPQAAEQQPAAARGADSHGFHPTVTGDRAALYGFFALLEQLDPDFAIMTP